MGFANALYSIALFSVIIVANVIFLIAEVPFWAFQVVRLIPYIILIQYDYWHTWYYVFKDKLLIVADFIILEYDLFKEEYTKYPFMYTGFYVTWPIYIAYWGVLYSFPSSANSQAALQQKTEDLTTGVYNI